MGKKANLKRIARQYARHPAGSGQGGQFASIDSKTVTLNGITASPGAGISKRELGEFRQSWDKAYDYDPNDPESVAMGEVLTAFNHMEDSDLKDLRVAKDENGVIQAAAYVGYAKETEDSPAHLSIYQLCSAPWNRRGDPRRKPGAGTALILSCVQESINKGGEGRVRLDAYKSAVPFYESLGFTIADDHEEIPAMKLSKRSAKELLRQYQSKKKKK